LERRRRGQLPERDQRAGGHPRGHRPHRLLRGDTGRGRGPGRACQCGAAADGGPGMVAVTDLVREDLRDFAGYGSARSEQLQGEVWLNANESAWANAGDAGDGCRRYPEPQPPELAEALARLYGCAPAQLLIGRGSDEAIDLLVRALCTPGRDAVAVTPPVFGMYAVSARLQGARLLEVPLIDGVDGFAPDLHALAEVALARNARLVFLCSPGNPTGDAIA